jgi:hypothetical protein
MKVWVASCCSPLPGSASPEARSSTPLVDSPELYLVERDRRVCSGSRDRGHYVGRVSGVWGWLGDGDNVVALIGLLATLALLGVTYWSSKTAKDMAVIARDAAAESARATEAAERSAQAALDAARVAQSQTKVEFGGRTIPFATVHNEGIPTVEIRAVGDAVVVQGVRAR